MRLHLATITLVLLIFAACRHTVERPLVGTGEPGPGKIVIYIGGWIEHPGRYYLDDDATLESALTVFGGFRGVGFDGKPSSKVTLRRKTGETEEQFHYRFREMTQTQRQAVRLQDGDQLDFTRRIF